MSAGIYHFKGKKNSMPEKIKVDDIILKLDLLDAVTEEKLTSFELFSVKKSEYSNLDFIINAEDKMTVFKEFCEKMEKELVERIGHAIFWNDWKWKESALKNDLKPWKRLIDSNIVKLVWTTEESHHYTTVPTRRIRYSSSDKNDLYIKMVEIDRNDC
jgi:hypothetical protein